MNWATLLDGMRGLNIAALEIVLRRRRDTTAYISACVQQADELLNRGLPAADPVEYLQRTLPRRREPVTLSLPTDLHDGGGTRLDELTYLAAVTRLLQPRKVFEIGTFKGRTTTVFALNAPGAEILTLDLPPGQSPADHDIPMDLELARGRNPAEFLTRYGISGRCRQVLVDSRLFDPGPHRSSVELAFIDGAHSYEYVRNDTEKVAHMMAPRGLVFWHDYGGRGRLRGISDYLHELQVRFPVYRVPGTTLAWARAVDVRRLAPEAPAMPRAVEQGEVSESAVA